MIAILIIIGIFAACFLFVPQLIVAIMKLTVTAAVCYIITTTLMKKEIGYLIIILFWFAVVGLGAQHIMPHAESIKSKVEKLEDITDKVDQLESTYDHIINFGRPKR